MDLKRLETFRSIARHGSLSRAAAERGQTLSAISIQLKKLESEVGTKLFYRLPNKLSLTDHGRIFLKEIGPMFDVLEHALAAVADPADGFLGSASVSFSSDIARFVSPGIVSFMQQHPKLNVSVAARPTRETIAMVTSGEIDMGVGFFRTTPRGIVRRKISKTGLSLVVPQGHPLDRRKRPSLKDIANYRVIVRRQRTNTRRMIDGVFAQNGVALPNLLEVGRCHSVLDFVEFGFGVGLVHTVCGHCGCLGRRHAFRLIELNEYFNKTDVVLITRSPTTLTPAQQALAKAIVESAVSPQDISFQGAQ